MDPQVKEMLATLRGLERKGHPLAAELRKQLATSPTEDTGQAVAGRLLEYAMGPYRAAGAPYGESQEGLRRWSRETEAAYRAAGCPYGEPEQAYGVTQRWALEQLNDGRKVWERG